MSKKLLLAATLFFTLIMMCFSVSASDVNALAFSSTGYDGDEVQIFSPPDSGTLSVFTLEDSGWYFYGLNSITGMRVKNDIPYVFAVVGKPDPTDEPDTKYKTELMIDLSGDSYDLTRFSTMYFGIAIVGDNDIKYTVSASLYSGGGRIDCETLVGIGKRRSRVGSPPKRKNKFRSSFRPTPSKSKISAFIRCACSSLLDFPR